MKLSDSTSAFTVAVSAAEVDAWNRTWPCSTLRGQQSFTFDKKTGDLIDREGDGDGSEAVALSHDAQAWGERMLGLLRKDY